MASALAGSKYDGRVFNRETIVITKMSTGTTVRANQVIVSNHGSAFEKTTPTNSKAAARLAAVKAQVDG